MFPYRTLVKIVIPAILLAMAVAIEVIRFSAQISETQKGLIKRYRATLEVFRDYITDDVLEDRRSKIYEKCKMFYGGDIQFIRITNSSHEVLCAEGALQGPPAIPLNSQIFFGQNDKLAAEIDAEVSFVSLKESLRTQSIYAAFGLLGVSLSIWILLSIFGNHVARLLESLEKSMSSGSLDAMEATASIVKNDSKITEIQRLSDGILEMVKKVRESSIRAQVLNSSIVTSRAFAQVAHDMKSPVSVLNLILSGAEMSEEKRQVLKSAAGRISNILDSLSPTMKTWKSLADEARQIKLTSIIQWIVAEKRIEVGERPITIDFELGIQDHNEKRFPHDTSEMARVLSNLLNNSIEAAKPNIGLKVLISLEEDDQRWIVKISDNGVGIEQDILNRVRTGEGGNSNKEMGLGLGLSHAFIFMRQIGGMLEVHSSPTDGTAIALVIPKNS